MSQRLHHLLERSALAYPARVAVELASGEHWSYRELERAAATTSAALVERGIGPDCRVGILMPRKIDTLVALFGILKTGAAYVPCDPGAPVGRTAEFLGDCAVSAVIAPKDTLAGTPELVDHLDGARDHELPGGLWLRTGTPATSINNAEGFPAGGGIGDLAYILHTSGSTGKPKGVAHTHRSALAFVDWSSETFAPRDEDVFSSFAPFHFDLSIFDIFVSLKHGARLLLFDELASRRPSGLAAQIAERGVTIWYSTPSVLQLLIEYGQLDRFDWSRLRIVLFAGEIFPPSRLRALQEHWPAPAYYNLFGPTETNVCTAYHLPQDAPWDAEVSVPIGPVCPHSTARVVGPDGEPMRSGNVGELLVSGETLMAGYWNLPRENERAMIADEAGRIWYRTGDLVREGPGGDLHFEGRKDRMIKRHGYRIELGEIEAALNRHPQILDVALVARTAADGSTSIDAYFAATGSDAAVSTVALKAYCAGLLPGYMIPDRLVRRERLPKTSTDKTDYRKLAEED